MSRMRETNRKLPENGNTEGPSRAAFTARLHVILQHWSSADRLARAMGVSPSAFRKWLRGEAEPSRERLVALADAARVGIAWLATGEGPPPTFAAGTNAGARGRQGDASGQAVDASRFIILPKEAEAAAAGSGMPAPPQARPTTEYIAFRHDWVRAVLGIEPGELILETASGESMQPTIQDGDLLLVDTTDRAITSFGVYVMEVAGERLVKRVQRKLDGTLVLISDNA